MANAFFMMILEIVKAMILKIAFKSVLERFITRLVIWGGRKLVKMTTNKLDDKTWLDIEQQLTGKNLIVADQSFKKIADSDFSGFFD